MNVKNIIKKGDIYAIDTELIKTNTGQYKYLEEQVMYINNTRLLKDKNNGGVKLFTCKRSTKERVDGWLKDFCVKVFAPNKGE